MSPGAFAGGFLFSNRREGAVEVLSEASIAFELGDWTTVRDVEDAGGFERGQVEGCGSGIFDVDLIKDALAGFFNDGGTLSELAENDTSVGPIESGKACNGATGSEDDFLGFEEEL